MTIAAQRERSAFFDWAVAIAGFWSVTGLYTDFAYHIRYHEDTFFTIQHAILYSGLLALVGVTFLGWWRPGYRTSLWGLALFAAGGASDMAKHIVFGFEHDFDAITSPTHIALGSGMAIAVCGPIRSAISGPDRPKSLVGQLPAIVGLSGLFELLHWVTNPYFRYDMQRAYITPVPHNFTADALTLQTLHIYEQGAAFVAVLLQALFLVSAALYVARNLRPAFGAFAALFVLSNVLIAVATAANVQEAVVVIFAAAASGLAADIFARNGPVTETLGRCASFCALIPVAYNASYVLAVLASGTAVWWNVWFAVGSIVLAAIFAGFLSFIAVREPDRADAV